MDIERARRRHRRLPAHERLAPGPKSIHHPQRTLKIAADTLGRLRKLTNGRPIGPMVRWAYALGRAALMARLSAGDRWDRGVTRGGRGPLSVVSLPSTYLRGWPELECSHGAACRLAIDLGLGLLEFEHSRHGWVELPDERLYDPIAAEHHPERYCTPEAWTRDGHEPRIERLRSGTTWLG